ncbi:MAG TPA: phosphopantothenoylcysteine decarboxylase, partial [Candidatus Lustribacter sp.]|nr:phosphopantothenoylcysteine decarboxylase [Candidatus Lustribacter sp.]
MAGATTTRSVCCPSRTWGTSWTSCQTSVWTGLPDSAAHVGAPTNASAAAVADFRPRTYAAAKIKKSHAREAGSPTADEPAPTVELVRNPDILAGLVQARGAAHRPLIVGFAAETGDS